MLWLHNNNNDAGSRISKVFHCFVIVSGIIRLRDKVEIKCMLESHCRVLNGEVNPYVFWNHKW